MVTKLEAARLVAIAVCLTPVLTATAAQSQSGLISQNLPGAPVAPPQAVMHRKEVQLERFENSQVTLQINSQYPNGFGVLEYVYFVPQDATEITFKKKGRGICTLTLEREISCKGEITSFQASYRQVLSPKIDGRSFTIELRSYNTYPIALEQTLSYPDYLVLATAKPAPIWQQGNKLRWQIAKLVDFRPVVTFLDPRRSK